MDDRARRRRLARQLSLSAPRKINRPLEQFAEGRTRQGDGFQSTAIAD
ncbi:MAG: hypothetical protein ACLQAT_26075 [Candidatus Binataceae bacterium]